MTDPRYGFSGYSPTSLWQTTPTLGETTAADWRLGWFNQAMTAIKRDEYAPDPSYEPWNDLEGYEQHAVTLAQARSPRQMTAMKAQIDANEADKQRAARSPYKVLPALLAGVADPLNLIPIPLVKGIGMVRGALIAGASTAALSAAGELVRQTADPTAEPDETPYNIGSGFLFGALFGGASGAFRAEPRVSRLAADRVVSALANEEYGNVATSVKFGEEGLELVRERPAFAGPVSIVTRADSPRQIYIDEAQVKAENIDGRGTESRGLAADSFRSDEEWLTYRTLEELNRELDPGASDAQVVERSWQEIKGRRTPFSYAAAYGLEKLSEAISPVGRAVSRFRDDNVLTALPLLMAGDAGVMLRANRSGGRLPASVYVNAKAHHGRFLKVHEAITEAYQRAIKGPDAESLKVLNQNVSASLTSARQYIKQKRGGQGTTLSQFAEEVSLAQIHNHDPAFRDTLHPEAVKAADTLNDFMSEYNAEASRFGLFDARKNVERQIAWKERSLDRKKRLADEVEANSRSTAERRPDDVAGRLSLSAKEAKRYKGPVVRVGDELFGGTSHADEASRLS